MDVGILTVVSAATRCAAGFRSRTLALEERLRAALVKHDLPAAAGGGPFHPEERVADDAASARRALHTIVELRANVLVVFLADDAAARDVARLVRYLDLRVSPALPVALFATPEAGPGSEPALLRASAELRAWGRPHRAWFASIDEDDAAFCDFMADLQRIRDGSGPIPRTAAFKNDLRRAVHMIVGDGAARAPSWGISEAWALRRFGMTVERVPGTAFAERIRMLLPRGAPPHDPRLVKMLAQGASALEASDWAAAFAAADLADERLATTVSLATPWPDDLRPGRALAHLNAISDPFGRAKTVLAAADRGDDAGALTQHLLLRSEVRSEPTRPWADPMQTAPSTPAFTADVVAVRDQGVDVAFDAALVAEADRRFGDAPLTLARATFADPPVLFAARAARLEACGHDPRLRTLRIDASARRFRAEWPGDRVSVASEDRLFALRDFAVPLGFDFAIV